MTHKEVVQRIANDTVNRAIKQAVREKTAATPATLADLPDEMILMICSYLPSKPLRHFMASSYRNRLLAIEAFFKGSIDKRFICNDYRYQTYLLQLWLSQAKSPLAALHLVVSDTQARISKPSELNPKRWRHIFAKLRMADIEPYSRRGLLLTRMIQALDRLSDDQLMLPFTELIPHYIERLLEHLESLDANTVPKPDEYFAPRESIDILFTVLPDDVTQLYIRKLLKLTEHNDLNVQEYARFKLSRVICKLTHDQRSSVMDAIVQFAILKGKKISTYRGIDSFVRKFSHTSEKRVDCYFNQLLLVFSDIASLHGTDSKFLNYAELLNYLQKLITPKCVKASIESIISVIENLLVATVNISRVKSVVNLLEKLIKRLHSQVDVVLALNLLIDVVLKDKVYSEEKLKSIVRFICAQPAVSSIVVNRIASIFEFVSNQPVSITLCYCPLLDLGVSLFSDDQLIIYCNNLITELGGLLKPRLSRDGLAARRDILSSLKLLASYIPEGYRKDYVQALESILNATQLRDVKIAIYEILTKPNLYVYANSYETHPDKLALIIVDTNLRSAKGLLATASEQLSQEQFDRYFDQNIHRLKKDNPREQRIFNTFTDAFLRRLSLKQKETLIIALKLLLKSAICEIRWNAIKLLVKMRYSLEDEVISILVTHCINDLNISKIWEIGAYDIIYQFNEIKRWVSQDDISSFIDALLCLLINDYKAVTPILDELNRLKNHMTDEQIELYVSVLMKRQISDLWEVYIDDAVAKMMTDAQKEQYIGQLIELQEGHLSKSHVDAIEKKWKVMLPLLVGADKQRLVVSLISILRRHDDPENNSASIDNLNCLKKMAATILVEIMGSGYLHRTIFFKRVVRAILYDNNVIADDNNAIPELFEILLEGMCSLLSENQISRCVELSIKQLSMKHIDRKKRGVLWITLLAKHIPQSQALDCFNRLIPFLGHMFNTNDKIHKTYDAWQAIGEVLQVLVFKMSKVDTDRVINQCCKLLRDQKQDFRVREIACELFMICLRRLKPAGVLWYFPADGVCPTLEAAIAQYYEVVMNSSFESPERYHVGGVSLFKRVGARDLKASPSAVDKPQFKVVYRV